MSFIDNREFAMLLWLIIAVVMLLAWRPARESAKELVNAALEKKLLLIQACFLAYCLVIIYFLSIKLPFEARHYWIALLWVFISGLGSVFSTIYNSSDVKAVMLRDWVLSVFSATALIEILVGLRSFHWLFEFILIPLVVLLLYLTNSRKPDIATDSRLEFYRIVLSMLGVAVLTYSVYSLVVNPSAYVSGSFLIEISFPAFLSLLCIPFLYGLFLVVCYETSITRLPKYLDELGLKSYAITSSILAFAWDVESVKNWANLVLLDKPDSKAAIQLTISKIYKRTTLRRRVYKSKGDGSWNPSHAQLYLSDLGLPTNKYHADEFDESEWRAISTYDLIGDDPIQNAIAYYVYGDEFAARKLLLKLNMQVPSKFTEAWAPFEKYCLELSRKSLVESTFRMVQEKLKSAQPFEVVTNSHTIAMVRNLWEHNHVGGYEMVYTITPNS